MPKGCKPAYQSNVSDYNKSGRHRSRIVRCEAQRKTWNEVRRQRKSPLPQWLNFRDPGGFHEFCGWPF